MKVLNLSDKRVSINHAELWGTTDNGQRFYMRFRSGLLDVRTARTFDDPEEGFISESSARSHYRRRYQKDHYQEVKRQYENWDDLLKDTPYQFENEVKF